jgi:tetratricopeptide (TPR) repeat protein
MKHDLNTAPPGDESGQPVDAGLRAAFDPSDSLAFPPPSALEALSRSASTSLPRILLRSAAAGEPESVVRPSSEELPAGPTGRYQLHGEIARGGMGVVVRGRDVDLGRDLALKVLLGRHQKRPEMIERFVEEAQIGGQLQHPGIVPVYELGHFPGGRPYFTMKLVKGKTLAALLAARKDPGEDRAKFLGIFEQVAQTLAYTHARGVIHRDLKPSNVMVGSFGEVQVMDWGLAKVLRDGGVADEKKAGAERAAVSSDDFPARRLRRLPGASSIRTARSEGSSGGSSGYETEAGSVLGTPAYMAPEQARGEVETVDERADVFGLGAILCEVLTGDPPFTGRPAEAQRKARQGDVREAWERLGNCGADPEVVEIARRCLEPVPHDRPANAGEVAAAVSAHLESVERRLRKAELERAEEQARAEEAQARMREEERGRKEAQARALAERHARRLTVALAALAILVVTGGGAAGLWIKAERDQKRSEIGRQVHLALERAVSLQARAASAGGLGPWREARAEAERARGLAESGGAGGELLTRVRDLLEKIDEEERRQRLLADLEAAWLAQMDSNLKDGLWSRERAVPILRDALEAFGLPAGKGDAKEAAARIVALPSSMRDALIAALDDWIYIAGNPQYKVVELHLEWLKAVVGEADSDPWRKALRKLMAESDPEERKQALEKLAEAPELARQPLPDLILLTRQLESSAPDKAVQVLAKANEAHRGDFSVLFRLGFGFYWHLKPPRPDEAVRYLTAAVALRPQNARAHLNLGNALGEQGKLDEAIAAYKRAIRLQSEYPAAYNDLGLAMEKEGKHNEALANYRKAIELKPDFAVAYSNIGNVLMEQGEVEEALAHFRKAIEIDPNSGAAHNDLGIALAGQGKVEEAIACYRKAMELLPKNPAPFTNLANALRKKGNFGEAIALYQKAIKIDPYDASTYNSFGGAMAEQGKFEEAISLYQKAIDLKPNSDHYCNLALAFAKQHRYEEAITAYQKAIELNPSDAEAHIDLGGVLANHGKPEEAIALIKKALELKPDYAEAHSLFGVALFEQGKVDEAIAHYRKAIELKPDYAEAHDFLGNALETQGNLEEAATAHQKAIELDPNSAQAHSNLGNTLKKQGKLEEAVTCFKKAIELDPGFSMAYSNLGNALSAQRKLEEAITFIRKAIELKPDYSNAYNNLGAALWKQGKSEEAIAAFKKAVELTPNDADAYHNLGVSLGHQDRSEEAIATWKKVIELTPRNAQAYYELGVNLWKQHRIEEAGAAYRKTIELNPDHVLAHINLGCVLASQRKLEEAIPQLEYALEREPENSNAHYNLGVVLRKVGRFEEAIAHFKKVIQLDPRYPDAYQGLGNVLAAQDRPEEAIALYKKALELNPEDAGVFCDLGLTFEPLGRFAEMRKWLERGHALGSKDPRWDRPSAEWVEHARRLEAAEARLPALLKGEPAPSDALELFDLAWVAYTQKLFHAAGRFYAEGLSKGPELVSDLDRTYRYNGACAAALAGSGRGKDADSLEEGDRARWRRQAREWLRADLKLWEARAAGGKPEDRDKVRRNLEHSQRDPDLAGIREKEALSKLPPAEAQFCRKLWKDVAGLLERVRSPKEVEKNP